MLNCVDCIASFFFNQGNVNHDGWHQRLGHKIPALLLRLLGCAMEKCVWYLWHVAGCEVRTITTKYATTGVQLHSLEKEIWSKVGWVDV